MELISGGTLKQKLGKPLHYTEAIPLILPIIHALGYAHSIGIIHRDVKPSNILITESGQPLLSDFGIAKIFEDRDTDELTGTGIGIGTPDYMSPEQGMGSTSQESDIYSLGTVLYEMLTGHRPFMADTPLTVLLKKSTEPLPSPRQFVREIPKQVEDILEKSLAINPSDRYRSANDLANALEKVISAELTYDELESSEVKASKRNNWFLLFFNRIKQSFTKVEKKQSITEINQRYIDSWKEIGTMTINMIAALEPHRQRRMLTLINRDHELRIKDVLVHFGGGRYLLHGFGRFGASALIDQIVTHAQLELQTSESTNRQGIVMVIRVELGDTSDQTKALVALVREFRFEANRDKYAQSIMKRLDKLQKNNFTKVSESNIENTVSIKATPFPGLETSFSRKSDKTSNPTNDSLTESGLIDVISQFLDRSEGKKLSLLESLVEKILNNPRIPARIIIVLDKIDSESAFQALQSIRVFSDERLTFFAIVRHENFIKWQSSTLHLINNIGFREYYVPCIWEEGHNLVRDMVKESSSVGHLDKITEEFIDYVAYKTRGAPGDIVKELVDPMHNTYEHGVPHLKIDLIRDKKLVEISAWRQRFLVKNWDTILGDDFLTLENSDRAKIGVYEVLDWMTQEVEFRLKDLHQSMNLLRVLISPSAALRRDVIKRLTDCMIRDRLLLYEQGVYRIRNSPDYADTTFDEL